MVDANGAHKNILSQDVHVKGELTFGGELLFDGKLEGIFRSEGNLLVGENAQVQGDIHVGNVAVRGRVNGNIVAANKVDLRSKAELQGDITAARLVMDETVTFCGKIDVNPSRAPAQPGQPVRPAVQGQPVQAVPVAPRVEQLEAAARAAQAPANGNARPAQQPVAAGAR